MIDDDKMYQELTIIIPKSSKIEHNNFFMNPDVDENIIKVDLNDI